MPAHRASQEQLKPSAEQSSSAPAETKSPERQSAEAQKAEGVLQQYLSAESSAANVRVENDVEERTQTADASHGYVPYLESLLREVADNDEWFGDSSEEQAKEKALLQSTAAAAETNLNGLKTAIESLPTASPVRERLRKAYVERRGRLTELLASADTRFENAELRDPEAVVHGTLETMRMMTVDEAVDWTQRMMSMIDGNNWQSGGLKETYGKLAMACRQGLQSKLADEKVSAREDPKKMRVHAAHCMEIAKLFTDRGSPIDNNLTDIDFAADMAREAMDFRELALRYVESGMKRENPVRWYVRGAAPKVLAKIAALPPQTRDDPQVVRMTDILRGEPKGIEGMSEQYAVLRQLECLLAGTQAPNLEEELQKQLGGFMEHAFAEFETFLNGGWGGAASLESINAAIGNPPMSDMQVEAWKLLADIQGYGYDVSDKTWSYVAEGAKIAAMIAAGIAVGIATGGLGVIGAAVVGGATMTATNALINQQGFDNTGDALKTYGTDFALNAGTMGAARYLSAGRAAYQLSRAGLLQQAGGVGNIMKIAGQKGGLRIINSFDDAASIGTRLSGATLEGAADTVIGASLDTAVQGGTFLENLQNNAMFFGLNYAEFAGPGVRRLRGMPPEELHGVAGVVHAAGAERAKLNALCDGTDLDPQDLLKTQDLPAKLTGLPAEKAAAIAEGVASMRAVQTEFEDAFNKIKAGTAEKGDGKASDGGDKKEEQVPADDVVPSPLPSPEPSPVPPPVPTPPPVPKPTPAPPPKPSPAPVPTPIPRPVPSDSESNRTQVFKVVRDDVDARKGEIVTERPKREPFRVGQEVYSLSATNGVAERGWFLRQAADGQFIVVKTTSDGGQFSRIFNQERVAHISEVEGGPETKGSMPKNKAFEMLRRKFSVVGQQRLLDEQQVRLLFRNDLRQQNVGNCYLIAAFNSLKQSPHFHELMAMSIRQTSPPERSGYVVSFPLGSLKKTRTVHVDIGDLFDQKLHKADRKGRTSLKAVQGSLGWKILEAAFIKDQTGKLDRAAVEGGFGHNALGAMFQGNATRDEVGRFQQLPIAELSPRDVKQTEEWLNRFSNGQDIATVNSRVMQGKNDTYTYDVQGTYGLVKIFYQHAYSIQSVDKFARRVVVKNPHDTSKAIVLSYEDFMKAFTHVSSVKLDFDKLFT